MKNNGSRFRGSPSREARRRYDEMVGSGHSVCRVDRRMDILLRHEREQGKKKRNNPEPPKSPQGADGHNAPPEQTT